MRVLPLLFSVLLIWLAASPALAQSRHALVVGIDGYDHVEDLQKARNDARSIHAALEEAGFEADLLLDTAGMALLQGLERFASRIEPGDEAVFFYAGHGVELDGENFLLPADIPAPERGGNLLIRRFALPVQDVLDTIQSRGARVALLMLDACRDNPFPRQGTRSLGGTRGLARMQAPEGAYIMYSAGAGQAALDRLSNDDPDPNSVFTRALLPRLTTPGMRLRNMVLEVRSEVRKMADGIGHNQFPAVYDQLDGTFRFIPAAMAPAPQQTRRDTSCAAARSVWAALHNTEDEAALTAFAEGYADSCPALAAEARERLDALQAQASVETCENLASGLVWEIGEHEAAIEACQAAQIEFPDNASVMLYLANAYFAGNRPDKALNWYRRGAEAGSGGSMYMIGDFYRLGVMGLEQDYAEALRWFRRGAEAGNASSMYQIGDIYWFGRSVERDYAEATRWYRRSAEAGNESASHDVAMAYYKGLGVEQDHAEALRWSRRGAEAGNDSSMNLIGYLYNNGLSVEQDHAEAMRWYRRAAEAGNRTSMGNIGVMYHDAEGVSRDHREAGKWYMQSLKGSKARLSWAQENAPKWRSATLREVQRILREAGVYSGALDGAYGPQTEAALEAYAALE